MTNTGNVSTVGGRLLYRVLTGPDNSEFCERVSQALADGYELAGSPSITEREGEIIVAQAVVLSDLSRSEGASTRTGFAAPGNRS